MKRCLLWIVVLLAICSLCAACMEWDYINREDFDVKARGLFIVNEGNFQYGNASLAFYNPADNSVETEIFQRANGYRLGDVAQSMTIHGDLGWVVVNNSHVIFAIDTDTFREVGRVEGMTSPRYIHFVSDDKAYVTQIWDNRIFIINPRTFSISGYITAPDMPMQSGSTEQMVQIGDYVYVNCWSYQNRILKIDTNTDKVVGQLTVGIQPTSIVADRYGMIWTLTDGGYQGSPAGYEAPALFKIDPNSMSIVQRWNFMLGDTPSELAVDGSGSHIFWINNDIWRMDVASTRLPVRPFIDSRSTLYYGLTVDPLTDEVYIADAIDYQQPGLIYRYSPAGELVDQFYAGITPGAFAWKK